MKTFAKVTSWAMGMFWGTVLVLIAVGIVAIVMGAFGCATPVVGSPCPLADAEYCADDHTDRSCLAGVMVDFPCTGPAGCKKGPGHTITCDQTSGAKPATRCYPEYEGRGQCSPDMGSTVQCKSGIWMAVACPQGTKCEDTGSVSCK